MRVLIDECLDWRLERGLPGVEVSSVSRMGWSGIKNGRLLALAEMEFDVFIMGDRNLHHQQNTDALRLAIIVLAAHSTQLRATLPLMAGVRALLPNLRAGSVTVIKS